MGPTVTGESPRTANDSCLQVEIFLLIFMFMLQMHIELMVEKRYLMNRFALIMDLTRSLKLIVRYISGIDGGKF